MSNFSSNEHALFCGYLTGVLTKHGMDVAPVRDHQNNYTPDIVYAAPDGRKFVISIEETAS